MIKLNGNVLTEKGQVKANARKVLTEYVESHRGIFNKAEKNDNGTYSVVVVDESGNTIYVNFEVSVSTLNAGDRAKRKSKPSQKTESQIVVE